jgi:hypothetical protein
MDMLKEKLCTKLNYVMVVCMSWDSTVNKLTDHGIRNQGLISSGHRDFSLYHHIKINSADHAASSPVGRRVKWPGH